MVFKIIRTVKLVFTVLLLWSPLIYDFIRNISSPKNRSLHKTRHPGELVRKLLGLFPTALV